MTKVLVYPNPTAVADATAARMLLTIGDVLAEKDIAHVVLTGGTVGIATLAAAAKSPLAELVNWTSVHFWWGDERFVPAGHPDRNEGQAQEALLRHLPIPEDNIHRMGASSDFDTAAAAARDYENLLSKYGNPEWDILLLGLGPDGHVASLFPAHPDFDPLAQAAAIAVENSPKPPPTRVSLTLRTINKAQRVWVVAAGKEKTPVIADCLAGKTELPGSHVRGSVETLWFLDVHGAG